MATGGGTGMEEDIESPDMEQTDQPSDVRRVETVKLPSLDDDELGPGIQQVQPSLIRGREGVYIDDPVVSIQHNLSSISESNSSFTSAMGTPTAATNKPSKSKVRTLDFYYNKTSSSLDLNKQATITRASKSAAELGPVPDITAHLSDDNIRSSGNTLHLSDEDTSNPLEIISHTPEPLPKRTPKRGKKRLRNNSKNIDNYVETHDANKAPTFTFDMQKFIQFLPADFQLLSTHKLKPSLLQTNNREFVPIPETGVDLFVRARAGLVLQVRSEKRAVLLENYVQKGFVPRWATHIDPMPGYIHPIAEKIAPLLRDQAHQFMSECAVALRNQARVVGERALYDQEVLERTFQADRHGYQVAITRLHGIKDREKQRIHDTVEGIKNNMSLEATKLEDVTNYIRGKALRKYPNPSVPRSNPRGRGVRGRGRGGFSNNRPRAYNNDNRGDNPSGYQSFRPNPVNRGGYSYPPPSASRGGPSTATQPTPQEYYTRDRSLETQGPSTSGYTAPQRNPSQETVVASRARSRSPLANVPVVDTVGHYDNNRVGPPTRPRTQPPAPSQPRGNPDLSDRDVERIAAAFMTKFRAEQQ